MQIILVCINVLFHQSVLKNKECIYIQLKAHWNFSNWWNWTVNAISLGWTTGLFRGWRKSVVKGIEWTHQLQKRHKFFRTSLHTWSLKNCIKNFTKLAFTFAEKQNPCLFSFFMQKTIYVCRYLTQPPKLLLILSIACWIVYIIRWCDNVIKQVLFFVCFS